MVKSYILGCVRGFEVVYEEEYFCVGLVFGGGRLGRGELSDGDIYGYLQWDIQYIVSWTRLSGAGQIACVLLCL